MKHCTYASFWEHSWAGSCKHLPLYLSAMCPGTYAADIAPSPEVSYGRLQEMKARLGCLRSVCTLGCCRTQDAVPPCFPAFLTYAS